MDIETWIVVVIFFIIQLVIVINQVNLKKQIRSIDSKKFTSDNSVVNKNVDIELSKSTTLGQDLNDKYQNDTISKENLIIELINETIDSEDIASSLKLKVISLQVNSLKSSIKLYRVYKKYIDTLLYEMPLNKRESLFSILITQTEELIENVNHNNYVEALEYYFEIHGRLENLYEDLYQEEISLTSDALLNLEDKLNQIDSNNFDYQLISRSLSELNLALIENNTELKKSFDELSKKFNSKIKLIEEIKSDELFNYRQEYLESIIRAKDLFEENKKIFTSNPYSEKVGLSRSKNNIEEHLNEIVTLLNDWDITKIPQAAQLFYHSVYSEIFTASHPQVRVLLTKKMLKQGDAYIET